MSQSERASGASEREELDGGSEDRLLVEAYKALSGRLREMTAAQKALESEVASLRKQLGDLRSLREVDAKAIRQHEVKIERLRIDRQLRRAPAWLAGKVRLERVARGVPSGFEDDEVRRAERAAAMEGRRSLLVICPKYPSATTPYGGQPVERRVRLYAAAGFAVTVFVPSTSEGQEESRDGITVLRGPVSGLSELLRKLPVGTQVCLHHPLPDTWAAIRSEVGRRPVHVWIHGFEARRWRDMAYNLTAEEIRERGSRADAWEVERQRALHEVFCEPLVTKIFVSEYMRGLAEDFVGVGAVNAHIIHNVIDTEVFSYRAREPEERFSVVAVRSFAGRKYATDLLVRCVRQLNRGPYASQLEFSIVGDGRHFEDDVSLLNGFTNVKVERRFMEGGELSEYFNRHGVLLIPTRWDSQGMTMGEGMASGLVPVTNAVSGIPEFVDESCAVLAEDEDVEGLAEGLESLCDAPERFLEMSASAAERVRQQCGPQATVEREMELFLSAP